MNRGMNTNKTKLSKRFVSYVDYFYFLAANKSNLLSFLLSHIYLCQCKTPGCAINHNHQTIAVLGSIVALE